MIFFRFKSATDVGIRTIFQVTLNLNIALETLPVFRLEQFFRERTEVNEDYHARH